MSITTRQKQLVQQSFAKVEPIADAAAELFYAALFKFDPSLKPLFKGDMKAQGKKLMTALTLAVKSLDDLDKLVPVLERLAIKHIDYGVKVDDYTPVGNALISALQQGLGDGFTDEVRSAWVATYQLVANVMRSAAYPDFDAASYKNTKQYQS